MYISYVERPHELYHRKHWIIHNGMWYQAEFDREAQLKEFAGKLGFTYELKEEKPWPYGGIYREYSMSHPIVDMPSFYSLSEIPEDVKPIKGLSNGSIVTCYYRKTQERIEFYRPNPNASEVYDPLPIDEHVAYCTLFGTF